MLAAIDRLRDTKSWQSKVEEDIREMSNGVFSNGGQGFHEFMLLAGNVEEADIKAIQHVRSDASLSPSLPYIPPVLDVFRPSFSQKRDQPTFLYKTLPDIPAGRSAVRLVVPVGKVTDPLGIAFAELINAVCAGQFFAALRTREQLGYAVGSMRSSIRGENYMGFLVQTEKLNGTETLGKIEKWVQNWVVEGLAEKDEYLEIDGDDDTIKPFAEHFEEIKDGVVKDWESKHPSLEAKTNEQENILLWSRDNLALRDQTLDAIRKMTREQFRSLVKSYFGVKESWRAVVLEAGAEREVRKDGWDVVATQELEHDDSEK